MKKELVFLSSPEKVSMADEWFEIARADHFWMVWRLEVIRRALKKMDVLEPTNRFLEIGCGHGEFLLQNDKDLNIITDGCDLNLLALNKVGDVKGEVYVYDILELSPKMIGKYDGIFLLDVIEHIDNDEQFLVAAMKHLTANGLVIINVPALSSLFSKYDKVAGHKRRYSKKLMNELFIKCGVELIHIQYWGFSLLPVALLRKAYLHFVSREKVIDKGFNPGYSFVNKLFTGLMKLELSLINNPALGTSITAIGRKKEMKNISLQDILARISMETFGLIERFSNRKNSFMYLILLSIVLSLFSAFPSYDIAYSAEMNENWSAILNQVKDPFHATNFHNRSHQANLAFRITPVLLAKILHIKSITGFLIFQFAAFVTLMLAVAVLLRRINRDPVVYYLLTSGVSLMFVGNVLCSDYRGFFDVLAFLFIVVSILFSNSALAILSLLLAYYTDERALPASGLIFIYFLIESKRETENSLAQILKLLVNRKFVFLILSWGLYFVSRYWLSISYGLSTNLEGMIDYLLHESIHQVNIFPFALWTGLEGFWLLVIFSIALLFAQGNFKIIALYFFSLGSIIFLAIWVFDITRSMAYLLPVIFLSLAVLSKDSSPQVLRYLSLSVFFLCAFPTYYAGGPNEINWLYPLPFQIFRMSFF